MNMPQFTQTTEEFKKHIEIKKAEFLLNSTDYKFNEDYDKKYTPEWEELKIKRAEARQFLRENKQDENKPKTETSDEP